MGQVFLHTEIKKNDKQTSPYVRRLFMKKSTCIFSSVCQVKNCKKEKKDICSNLFRQKSMTCILKINKTGINLNKKGIYAFVTNQ